MILCRCAILANYCQFTLLRLSQHAGFADALFFLMRAELVSMEEYHRVNLPVIVEWPELRPRDGLRD